MISLYAYDNPECPLSCALFDRSLVNSRDRGEEDGVERGVAVSSYWAQRDDRQIFFF